MTLLHRSAYRGHAFSAGLAYDGLQDKDGTGRALCGRTITWGQMEGVRSVFCALHLYSEIFHSHCVPKYQ
jgi:hypothetical protein